MRQLSYLILFLTWVCSANAYFTPFASTFDVIEESPIGTVIGNVAEYLNQIVMLNADIPNSTTFQVIGSDPLTRSFAIDSRTGVLQVASRVDREALCKLDDLISGAQSSNQRALPYSEKPCRKVLNILVESQTSNDASGESLRSKSSLRKPITLQILDINDHPPLWTEKTKLMAKFVESFQSSSAKPDFSSQTEDYRLLERAIDPDAGVNGTISYLLTGPQSELFRLEDIGTSNQGLHNRDRDGIGFNLPYENSDRLGSPLPPLRFRPVVPLDRESVAIYNLTLVAYDSGHPQLSSSIPLTVLVTDVNDNAPIFHSYMLDQYHKQEYKPGEHGLVRYTPPRGHLSETTPPDSVVLQLNATDRDEGENARIAYSFFPNDRLFAQRFFALDHITGHLKVKKRLDYDQGPRHFNFKVIAVDGAPEPYRLTGTAVVDIELKDVNDEPPKIEILIAQNGQSNFPMDTRNQFGNPLVHHKQELVAYIEEMPSPDIVIAYVQVYDKDENGEDLVRCHLGPRDNFTLQAEPFNQAPGFKNDISNFNTVPRDTSLKVGEYRILAKVPSNPQMAASGRDPQEILDREVTPSQLLTITCTDQAGNQAERRIRLHLLDTNDNVPKFLNDGHFSFSVVENKQPMGGQQVWLGRVVAFDPDLGDNAKITYKLATDVENGEQHSSSEIHRLFGVKPDTGDIYAQVALDREHAPDNGIYVMTVLAIDHGTPKQLTGTAKVEIVVLDVNDWPPEFTRDIYTFTVPENVDLREVIGLVEAVDRDATAAPNTITYHLNAPRQARTYSEYDAGASNIQKRSLNETTQPPTTVLKRIRRQARLQGSQPMFMPHLEPTKVASHLPFSYFSIDSRTGEIRIIRRLDRETNAYFTFEVLAVDSPLAGGGGVSASAVSSGSEAGRLNRGGFEVFTVTATVIVTVTDTNDNSPEFRYPNSSILFKMRPDEILGHKILNVQAVDKDEGENARISYSIRSEIPIPPEGPGTGNFAIDEATGLIYLIRPIRRPVNHRLVIEACDHGVPPRCNPSPGIRIAVSDDAKLGNHDSPPRGRLPSPEGLNLESERFGYEGQFVGPFDPSNGPLNLNGQQSIGPHRIEVIVACLVVVFGVLLFAAVVLACLLKRKPQQQQSQQQGGRSLRGCSFWGCRWPLQSRQQKTIQPNFSTIGIQGGGHLNDPRFADGQSQESSLAKGTMNADSITNTLEMQLDDEKKPLYYDGIGMLPDPQMNCGGQMQRGDSRARLMTSSMGMPLARPFRPVASTAAVSGGYTTGGTFMFPPGSWQQTMVFNGGQMQSGGHVYGTLPVVSTILSSNQMDGSVPMRPGFQPIEHPTAKQAKLIDLQNISSPDYQSLDVVTNGASGPMRNTCWPPRMEFVSSPDNRNSYSKQNSSSYGCLIDTVTPFSSSINHNNDIQSPHRQSQNYYEINTAAGPVSASLNNAHQVSSNGMRNMPMIATAIPKRYQRSATLGRLTVMDEDDIDSRQSQGGLHHPTAGDLTLLASSANNRSYSQLQAVPTNDEEGVSDKPTRYTYQAIREASFV